MTLRLIVTLLLLILLLVVALTFAPGQQVLAEPPAGALILPLLPAAP